MARSSAGGSAVREAANNRPQAGESARDGRVTGVGAPAEAPGDVRAAAGGPRAATVFAQNLLVARTVLELTQQALAAASGVSRATIAQLEAGTGDPKLSTVQQLAEAMGVSAVVLLLGRRELEALAAVTGGGIDGTAGNPTVSVMRHLVGTGGVRSRLEAARLGVGVALDAGVEEGAVGAAVGSFHHPGEGTLAGGRLAHALRLPGPKAVGKSRPQLS